MGIFSLEDEAFRQVENGYVFSVPWLFAGPSRRYLVNEAQKTAIAERLRRARQVLLLSGPFVGAAAGAFGRANESIFCVAILMIVALASIIAANIYRIYKLRPLLAGLPPTRERGLTWSERLKFRAAASTSLSWLVVLGLGFSAGCLMSAIYLAEMAQKTGPADHVIAVLCAAGAFYFAVYFFVLALYKYKARRT
jgi:hypothetical protein